MDSQFSFSYFGVEYGSSIYWLSLMGKIIRILVFGGWFFFNQKIYSNQAHKTSSESMRSTERDSTTIRFDLKTTYGR